jgi:hypothetical protein
VVGGGGVGDQAPGAPIIAPPGGSGGSSGVGGGSGALPRPLVCQADAAGVCSWQPVPGCRFCGPVSCRLACPYGFRKDASGCEICECNPDPAADCGRYADYMTCTASMACTWLQPGCGDPALAAAGCYARSSLNCTSDAQCTSGRQCLKRVINPCAVPPGGVGGCAACGQTISLCQ